MNCPKCKSKDFSEFENEGVVMDFCGECKGIWFDKGELAFYVETSEDLPGMRVADANAKLTEFMCPKCDDTHLIEIPYMKEKPLMIDYCQSCQGIFLDAGEIGTAEKLSASLPMAERLVHVMDSLAEKGYEVGAKLKKRA